MTAAAASAPSPEPSKTAGSTPGPGAASTEARDISEAEFATLGRWIARLYLEIERGQRSVRALERFTTRLLQLRLEETPVTHDPAPLRFTDLSGTGVSKIGDALVFITVAVREDDGGADCVLIAMRRSGAGRWQAWDICRLRERCPVGAATPGNTAALVPPPSQGGNEP